MIQEQNIITTINSLDISKLREFKLAIQKNFYWERNSKGVFIKDYREHYPLYLELLSFLVKNMKYVDNLYGFTRNMNNGGKALWLVNNAISQKENRK